MAKKQIISRYTVEQLINGEAGPSLSNWAAADAKTQEQVEADADSDDLENGDVWDWENGFVGLTPPKAVLNMRVDQDVLDFFKSEGRGYQTRMNAVLRSYMLAKQKKV